MSNYDGIDRNEVKHMSKEAKQDLNADIITGEPGSHPVGTAIGGLGGAAAGAAIGTLAGPLGTLIGGAIGAIVGGGAGHAAAEAIDPTREEAYQASLAVAFDEIKRDLTDPKISAKLDKFDQDAENLLAEYDAKLLVSLLLQAKVNDPDTRPKVEIAAEKPLPFNGEGGKGGGRGGNCRLQGGGQRRLLAVQP